jgi:AraC family transcriptional regulator
MNARIMQRVGATQRPLAFGPVGTQSLLIASTSTSWAGLQFEVHRSIPGELREAGPLEGEFGLVVYLHGSVELTACERGREVTRRAVPGTTAFMAGDALGSSRVTGSAELAAVHLTPDWFHRMDLAQAPADFGRMAPLVADQTLRSLLIAMRHEVEGGARTGRLFAESLSVALLSYVLDRVPLDRLRVRGALSDSQCRRLTKHVRERIGDDIALAELAAIAGLGARQFSKLFRGAFGVTPHRYVLDERLDEGARRLATSSLDVTEVALSLGFSTPSHFAAAFRARFGRSPRQYALEHRRHRSIS